MITSLFVASSADSYATTLELDTLLYPLRRFSWEYQMDGDNVPKTQQAGSWKAPKFVSSLPIEMEGTILADTTSEFWTRRKALLAKVIPAFANVIFDHVKFLLTVDGDAEVYYAFAVLEQSVGALEVTGSPTISDFQLMFNCREGYWRKSSDNSYVII